MTTASRFNSSICLDVRLLHTPSVLFFRQQHEVVVVLFRLTCLLPCERLILRYQAAQYNQRRYPANSSPTPSVHGQCCIVANCANDMHNSTSLWISYYLYRLPSMGCAPLLRVVRLGIVFWEQVGYFLCLLYCPALALPTLPIPLPLTGSLWHNNTSLIYTNAMECCLRGRNRRPASMNPSISQVAWKMLHMKL